MWRIIRQIEQELQDADDEHGGGPETDRDKERRAKFAKLWGKEHNPEQDDSGDDQGGHVPDDFLYPQTAADAVDAPDPDWSLSLMTDGYSGYNDL